MGSGIKCAGGLELLKAGPLFRKELISGLPKLEEANHALALEEPEKNMLYGLASTICLNLEQKELVTKHDQKGLYIGEVKVCK
jgi:hypothetical protein